MNQNNISSLFKPEEILRPFLKWPEFLDDYAFSLADFYDDDENDFDFKEIYIDFQKQVLLDYTKNHDFKINDLWQYYLFNRLLKAPIKEHQIFYSGADLIPSLKENYIHHFLAPLKSAFSKLKYPIFKKENSKQPHLKEKEELLNNILNSPLNELYNEIKNFFSKVKTGNFSNYYYFELNEGTIKGVDHYREKKLNELVGYEAQKEKLLSNTKSFLEGKAANHVFLYGSRGTGKTSLIQALLNEFKDEGLRLIKIYRDEIEELPRFCRSLKKRKERFILNLDDISYDEEEFVYKKHKVSLDSFFDQEPKNILLYATSNSQEIVKYFREETTDNMILDNRSDEEKKLEPPQRQVYDERRAFTERFGLSIFFGKTNLETASIILDFYRKKNKIEKPLEELLKDYNQWVMYHGAMNGRTIESFIKALKGN